MAHVSTGMDTTVSPQTFIGALTDFSDARLSLWPNIDRQHYQVHHLSETSAEVTEGSRGVWERTRYDWSSPGTVRIEVQDSNAFRPGSWWRYSVRPLPLSGSHVDLEFDRKPRNLKGFALSVLLSIAGGRIFQRFLEETLQRLEARNPAPSVLAEPPPPRAG